MVLEQVLLRESLDRSRQGEALEVEQMDITRKHFAQDLECAGQGCRAGSSACTALLLFQIRSLPFIVSKIVYDWGHGAVNS